MSNREHFEEALRLSIKASTELIAEEARENHTYKSRTGNLERAIDTRYNSNVTEGIAFLNSQLAKYGPFVHQGTKAHLIFPNSRKALRWVAGDRFRFAKRVRHPGTKADPFLYRAAERKRDDVNAIFERMTGRALEKVHYDIKY